MDGKAYGQGLCNVLEIAKRGKVNTAVRMVQEQEPVEDVCQDKDGMDYMGEVHATLKGLVDAGCKDDLEDMHGKASKDLHWMDI